jgi:hypothetical protein
MLRAARALEDLDLEEVAVGTPRCKFQKEVAVTYRGLPLRFALRSVTVRCQPPYRPGRDLRFVSFDVPGDVAAAMLKLEAAVKPSNVAWLSNVANNPTPRIRAMLLHRYNVYNNEGNRVRKLPLTSWCSHRGSAVLEVECLNINCSGRAFLELHVAQLVLGEEVF